MASRRLPVRSCHPNYPQRSARIMVKRRRRFRSISSVTQNNSLRQEPFNYPFYVAHFPRLPRVVYISLLNRTSYTKMV